MKTKTKIGKQKQECKVKQREYLEGDLASGALDGSGRNDVGLEGALEVKARAKEKEVCVG